MYQDDKQEQVWAINSLKWMEYFKDMPIYLQRIKISYFPHFRWKGENVATTEVSDVIVMLDFIQEANVYGVSVPGKRTFSFIFSFLCV